MATISRMLLLDQGNWRRRTRLALAVAVLILTLASCSQKGDIAESVGEQGVEPFGTPTATSTAPAPPISTEAAVTPAAAATAPLATETPAMAEIQAAFQPPDLAYLKIALDERLAQFDGLASYYVRDLKGGQVAVHNGDVAISGTSIVKIPILLETYRVLVEPPSIAEMRLITETATLSGNYTANLLLELVAGRPDPFAGAQQVTEAVRQLGLYNTFIAVPYDLQPDPRYFSTYSTPANQRSDLTTNPDSSMQTTVADMGELLTMIYDCSGGRGVLLELHAGDLTPDECRAVLDVMRANDIDAFVEEGVPQDVPVAHKHGWVGETHGDAALVEHADYPYVLVISLHRPGWLEWAESTVIIADLSRLAYAHFSNAQAYTPQELAQTPPALPTIAPTPSLARATVQGTGGAGVVLRDAPGGAEIMIVPEGSLVFLPDAAPVAQGDHSWRQITLLGDIRGWVVADFLAAQ